MKSYLVFLPILILAILESSIIPLNLVLLSIICWAVFRPAREGLVVAFFSGLILDFLMGRTVGQASLFFLIVCLLIYLYKNRFQANRFAFLLPFTFASVVVANFVAGLFPLSINTGVNAILIVPFLPLFNFLSKITENGEQLKLTFEEKNL